MLAVKKSIFIAAATVAALVVLAGCGASSNNGGSRPARVAHSHAVKTSTASSKKTGQKTSDTKPSNVPGQGVRIPTRFPNVVALRKYVAVSSCTLSKGVVRASGTAASHGRAAAGYRLTLFVTNSRSTVTGTGSATVHVAGHGTAKWSIKSSVVDLVGKPHCVLVGVGKG